jgi:acyl-CoA thioester hydrolase
MDELLATGGKAVPPEWIDYNGHMMDAYYFLAFTEATESFLDHVGLGAAYRASTGSGIYTAEGHLCFLAGVTGGAALSYQTQLLGHDAKRLHVFHQMTSADRLAATCELMFLHVSDGHVTPMPPAAVGAVTALAAGQAALPRPGQAGRHVGIPRRQPGRAGLTRPGCG